MLVRCKPPSNVLFLWEYLKIEILAMGRKSKTARTVSVPPIRQRPLRIASLSPVCFWPEMSFVE